MKNTLDVTRDRVVLASVLGLSTLLAAETANAQPRWGRPSEPRAGACFYRDFDFRGDYFCASAGEDLALLGRGMDNQISSIRTFGDAEVTIFQDSRFRGRWTRLENDVRNLRREGWNDKLSSIVVDRGWGRRRGSGYGIGRVETREWRREDRNDRRDDRADRRDDQRDDRNDRNDRRGDRNDRRISSAEAGAIVRRAYQDILQRDPDSQGLSLYRSRMVDEGWSESQVRDALRSSPEYKTKKTMTPQKAQELVAAAYRSVLHREPDGGSAGYVQRVLRDKWTQADVERELRKSDEYRNRRR